MDMESSFSNQVKRRIREANSGREVYQGSDFINSWLIPSGITEGTPRSVIATEFLLRIGVIQKGNQAEKEQAQNVLSSLSQSFEEQPDETRKKYAIFLGGSMLDHLKTMQEIVDDYSGVMLRNKLEDVKGFLGFVAANVLAPEDSLSGTA